MQVVKHVLGQELLVEIEYVQMLQAQHHMILSVIVKDTLYQLEHVQ
jgi:hypothetical protein